MVLPQDTFHYSVSGNIYNSYVFLEQKWEMHVSDS